MSGLKKKSWLVIFCYTILLSISILLSFYFFIKFSSIDTSRLPKNFTYTTPQDQGYLGNTIISGEQFISSDELSAYFQQAFFRYIPVLIVSVCILVLLFSYVLWFCIRKIEKKKNQEIATDLRNISKYDNENIHEIELKDEYKSIQEQLNAYAKDQKRLHSYIAHEQKNLIMLLKARFDEQKDIKLLKDIDKLSQSVEDILTVSSQNDDRYEVVDLAMIAAEEYDLYRSMYPNLSFEFDEDGAYTILGKSQWIRRALDNLLDNAIKYGNNKPIEITLKQRHNSVIISIIDNGIGMEEKQQNMIFDYCYQIQELNKNGYGIGLSLVKHVCELCNGIIYVKSQKHVGSEFIMTFPLYE